MARKWYYKPDGSAEIFEMGHAPAGWDEQPSEIHYCKHRGEPYRPVSPVTPASVATPNGPSGDETASEKELTDQEKLSLMTRPKLMQIACDAGVKFEMTWTKSQFREAIMKAMDEEI